MPSTFGSKWHRPFKSTTPFSSSKRPPIPKIIMASNEEGTKINESAYYEVRPAAGKDADVAEVQATMRDMKQAEFVPKPEDAMDALGIPDWRQLEKKVVRRLDMTLMPCLWGLYLFNYLDRASIA